jgi:hypothetical protein
MARLAGLGRFARARGKAGMGRGARAREGVQVRWAERGGEGERGKGRLGQPSWAREGVGLNSVFPFLFFFLSLFYLFQFDIMRKQMIK